MVVVAIVKLLHVIGGALGNGGGAVPVGTGYGDLGAPGAEYE